MNNHHDLPVLDELPELGELLDTLATIDQLTARAVTLIGDLQDTSLVEAATGIPLELWLSIKGRRIRSDRRMLAATADARDRLPATLAAFAAGQLSWGQVRTIVLACQRLPAHLATRIDDAIAAHLPRLADAEPDTLLHLVTQAATSIDPAQQDGEVKAAEERQFVHLQPRLDGTGGRLYGELSGASFALVADALDPGPPEQATRQHIGQDPRPDTTRQDTRARRRADRLVDLCANALADQPDPTAGRQRSGPPSGAPPVAPKVLLSLSLEQLLGLSDAPAEILTTVTGGRMRLSTQAAREWINARGASFRGIVIQDTGEILGVGRTRYRPPGWLRDALLVRDATCTAPLCRVSATLSQADHTQAWADGGSTDIANLGWLHQGCHTLKREWHASSQPDGTRTWTHPRTGLTVRHIPTHRKLPLNPEGLPPPGAVPPQEAAQPPPGQPTGIHAPAPGPPRTGADPPGPDLPHAGADPPDQGLPSAGSDPPDPDLPF